MAEDVSNPEVLTVLIAGRPVGTVALAETRNSRTLVGAFTPMLGIEPYRSTFETAVDLARQFNALPVTLPCDYQLWDRLIDAYAEINRLRPVFAERSAPIEEFAIYANWTVEVTFGVAPDDTSCTNPILPVAVNPRWLTSTVLDLAVTIRDHDSFDIMPILADALMDVGCDCEEMIMHCRSANAHLPDCWVVSLILKKN